MQTTEAVEWLRARAPQRHPSLPCAAPPAGTHRLSGRPRHSRGSFGPRSALEDTKAVASGTLEDRPSGCTHSFPASCRAGAGRRLCAQVRPQCPGPAGVCVRASSVHRSDTASQMTAGKWGLRAPVAHPCHPRGGAATPCPRFGPSVCLPDPRRSGPFSDGPRDPRVCYLRGRPWGRGIRQAPSRLCRPGMTGGTGTELRTPAGGELD